jgi:hypothetical protein
LGAAVNLFAIAAAALAALGGASIALAQPGGERAHERRPRLERPMPPPHYRGPMQMEERRRMREDLAAPQWHRGDDAEREARRREAWRLREEVRSGRLGREEAIRQYHERFGAPDAGQAAPPPQRGGPEPARIEQLREAVREGRMSRREAVERIREERQRRAIEAGRLSPEEREQLRRDVLEANRSLERR